jgi:asparagine synthetase A
LVGSEKYAQDLFPVSRFPERLTFPHTEEILQIYCDLPREQREKQVEKYPAIVAAFLGTAMASLLHSQYAVALRHGSRSGFLPRLV